MTDEAARIVSAEIHDDLRAAFAPDALVGLLSEFETDVREEHVAIRASAEAADPEALRARAHRMASAAHQYGFPELAGAAGAIEQRAAAGAADADLPRLDGCVTRALDALLDLRTQLGQGERRI